MIRTTRARRGASHPSEWSDAIEDFAGIDAAKKGFMGSMLGYGDRPTFDARQIALHVPDPGEASKFIRRGSSKGTVLVRSMIWTPLRTPNRYGFILGFQRRVW